MLLFYWLTNLSVLLPLVEAGGVEVSTANDRPECTVTALGDDQSDVPSILEAFDNYGSSNDIIFPKGEVFNISKGLHLIAKDVQINWQGEWLMSDDIGFWRNNSYLVPFQNHRAGIIFSGSGIHIDGHGVGGINGNGDVWYSEEEGETQEGRPMLFVLWNVSDVNVENFYIKQPPLWALNLMNGTDLAFKNILVNATSTKAPSGYNWVQNTDGFDTMDVRNVSLMNFVYQGGDDCIAIKPRSYNVSIHNVTCNGGNGVAIGSLGQYEEDSSVEDVVIDIIISSAVSARFTAYIKVWVGALVPQESYESDGQAQGNGWGNVTNVVFSNFDISGATVPPLINQNSGDNGSYAGTSKMQVSNILFANFTGKLSSASNIADLSCSEKLPCYDIEFDNMELESSDGDSMMAKCKWVEEGGVEGLGGC